MSDVVNEVEVLDEFDLDDLYAGVPQNSETPIDVSEPEVDDRVICAGGACSL